MDEYPALKENNSQRNEIRDRIISIVKYADEEKRRFLTIIDIYSATATFNEFHKVILSALLQCKKTFSAFYCLTFIYYAFILFSTTNSR